MEITVPVPTFSRRVSVSIPSLSRKQLAFMGGAAALGVIDVLSAPVAAVLASAPLLQKGVRRIAGSTEAANANGAVRRSPSRRTASSQGRSATQRTSSSKARSATRPSASPGGRGTRRSAPRSSRRATKPTAPAAVSQAQ